MRIKSLLAAAFILFFTLSTARAAEFEMISYSAQIKLQWLAAAGIPDAQRFNKLLGRPDFFNEQNRDDFDRLKTVNAIYNEFCYASFIDFIQSRGYKNVYEIGCSYSPRLVPLVNGGCKYVGAELAAVAYDADQLAKEVIDKKLHGNFAYFDAPVDSREAMLAAADFLGDNVCVIEQGLMIYFDRPKIATMLENIRAILEAHGGCYVTSNFCRKPYFASIVTPIYGANSVQTLYDETLEFYEEVLGDPMYDNTFASNDDALAFLDELGFKVQQVPLFTVEPELHSIKKLNPRQQFAIKALAHQKYIWVLTLK